MKQSQKIINNSEKIINNSENNIKCKGFHNYKHSHNDDISNWLKKNKCIIFEIKTIVLKDDYIMTQIFYKDENI